MTTEPTGKITEPVEAPIGSDSPTPPHPHLHGRSRTPSARVWEGNPYVERLEAMPDWIVGFVKAAELKGKWQSRYTQQAPLFLEIGSGYGHFLAGLAVLEPHHNFLGLELKFKRLVKAAQKVEAPGLRNVQYVRYDALQLDAIFAPGELAGVYVNFPDPWPKNRHELKRMVSPRLASQLEQLLSAGGVVRLKSDYEPNREAFRDAFARSRFELTDYVEALADWDRPESNVETSYEKRFRRQGLPCFFYEFRLN